MTSPLRAALLAALGALLALGTGCEEDETPPQKPQLNVNREVVDLGPVFIGTKPQDSLMIENGGLETLTITEVTKQGSSAFTFTGPTKMELAGRERAFIQVVFEPKAPQTYDGTLVIKSNAENAPEKSVELTGRGVDGGT
jgi:hypothetical protein